jgi:WD40 repeat protein
MHRRPDREEVSSLAIAADGTWLATASDDGSVRTWNPATGACTGTFTNNTGPVLSITIASDSTWLAAACDDETVRIWRYGSYEARPNGDHPYVSTLAMAPDGTWLATAGSGGSLIPNPNEDPHVRIWDRATGQCTALLEGHTDKANAVAIAPDGTWLASAGEDGHVRIWDRASGACTAVLDRTRRIRRWRSPQTAPGLPPAAMRRCGCGTVPPERASQNWRTAKSGWNRSRCPRTAGGWPPRAIAW